MRTGAVILLSLWLGGCAAVFRGSNDRVRIDSTPAGAEAKAADKPIGATPIEIEVPRKRSTEITLTKTGYETSTIIPKRRISPGWLVLDILTCPFLICI